MPYVEGGSLRDRLRREGRLPVKRRGADRPRDRRRPGVRPRPRRDPPRHQAREHPPGAGTRPARRLRHRPGGGPGHGRGADPRGHRGRYSEVHGAGAGRRRVGGFPERPLLARVRALRDARRRRPVHRTIRARHHRAEHAGPGAAGAGSAARGAGGARGADHPQPLRRALRPLPLGIGHRCRPGGQPDRAGDAGVPSSPRAGYGRRAGARPRRLPAPRVGRGVCPALRRRPGDAARARGPGAARGHLQHARPRHRERRRRWRAPTRASSVAMLPSAPRGRPSGWSST